MSYPDLYPGQLCIIKRILNSQDQAVYRRKLLSLGVIPGARLQVKRIAPLGDPIQFEINGFLLSLRRSELSRLLELERAES
jgi:ferrous iron transport protein A